MRRISLAALLAGVAHAALAAPTLPGPSQGLWDEHPGYSLAHPVYVSTTGSDTTGTGTAAAPWATLQHANDWLLSQPQGSVSAVVVEPGTYPVGVNITAGGAPGAYIGWRCAKMDACTITGSAAGQNGSFAWTRANGPGSYIIIDGFRLSAASAISTGGYGQGIQLWDGEPGNEKDFSVHHVVILNNIISGYGQAGINMNDGEYFYVIHNTVFRNANSGCSAQGSGIAFVVLKAARGYVRTRADADNPMVGAIGAFNNAIEWNVVYNNATTQCGNAANPYDTDGNGIIADTWTTNNPGGPYPGSGLIAFNVVYNNGGRGIHLFRTQNVTVANNSAYNNSLDPYCNCTGRYGIGDQIGGNNIFINNLSIGIPQPTLGVPNCGNSGQGCLGFNSAYFVSPISGTSDTFQNNIAYCNPIPTGYGWGCAPQPNGKGGFATTLPNVNPNWSNVGSVSQGNENTPPQGVNFALQPNSSAIGTGTLAPYLSIQAKDKGACSSLLQQCP